MPIRHLHIARYGEIVSVLVRYGFGDLLSRLNIRRYLGAGRKLLRIKERRIEAISPWDRIRMALEELGPAFIKLGQFAGNRPDVLPYELIAALERLQDAVPPFPEAQAVAIIERELGDSVDRLFTRFDRRPIASASIGQVHRAFLKDGREVAVKVQRPRIDETIGVDIDIMHHLAVLIEKHVEGMSAFNLQQLVDEFSGGIRKEMDFTTEAQNIEGFIANFKDDPEIYIPSVYRDYSTRKVITTEFVHGIKITRIGELRHAGLDPGEVARRGARIILKQIFEHGFFHADPHAGNILVKENNVLCFLDLGMAGIVTPTTRRRLSEIIQGIVGNDPEHVAKVLSELTPGRFEHRDQLEYEVAELIQEYATRPVGSINVGELLRRFSRMMVEHRFKLVPGFYLLVKSLITLEGIGFRLDPNFNLMEHLVPYARSLVYSQKGPKAIARRALAAFAEYGELIEELPSEARDILSLVKSGRLQIGFQHRGLETLLRKFDDFINRLVFGLVLAALIIGSSIVVLSNVPPKIYEVPVIGIVGFVAAGLMGFWLLIAMLRGKKI